MPSAINEAVSYQVTQADCFIVELPLIVKRCDAFTVENVSEYVVGLEQVRIVC